MEDKCKHEWVGKKWQPETQTCKHCKIGWYDAYPKYEVQIQQHSHYWGADLIQDIGRIIVICRTCGELKDA